MINNFTEDELKKIMESPMPFFEKNGTLITVVATLLIFLVIFLYGKDEILDFLLKIKSKT